MADEKKFGLLFKIRNYLITGILFSLPIILTFYIVIWIFDFFDAIIAPLINVNSVLAKIPGIGIVSFIGTMIIIGFVAQNFIGKFILITSDKIMTKIPVMKTIYSTLKQVFDTVLGAGSTSFKSVVLVEYPRKGMWSLAFVTSDTRGEIQEKTVDDVVSIFIPTTPNPTSGFLLYVPKKELINLNMKADTAMKLIISGGIVYPDDPLIIKEIK